MSRARIEARSLLGLKLEQLRAALPPKFTLVFDDGEIETTRRRTLISSFFWDYHLTFPGIPLKKTHHIELLYQKSSYNSDTHTDLCEKIEEDIYPLYEQKDMDLNAKLSKIAYDSSIRMTNELMPELAPYVSPLDLLDGIEIHRHPRIWEAIQNAAPIGEAVTKVYQVATDVIMNDPSLDNNALALAFRRNTVKREQVLQSVAMRGVGTEPNGKLFEISANSCYIGGFTKIFDFASDSRSAPKAQISAEAPLQDSEYMARRLQFLCSPVERLEGWDCGSTDYVNWLIDPEVRDEDGTLVSKGGISTMVGKHILDENGNVKILTGKEKWLNGTIVKMRSVLKCKNKNPHTVCRSCFGQLHRNYYSHQNLGHLCTVTFTEKVTQNTLSVKHLVATGQGARIQLNHISSKYFKVGKTKSDYILQSFMKRLSTKVTLPFEGSSTMVDALKVAEINELKLSSVTKLNNIKISFMDKGARTAEIVEINQTNRQAFVTLEFLEYIKEHGYAVDEENNFEIDMADWSYDKPIFAVPAMEVSYSEHGQEVGRMIESNMGQIEERQRPDSPLKTLHELNSLVNTKLDVPLSCLEVMIYASMVPSRTNPSLARGWDTQVLGVARQLIYSRSLSCAYSFQGHADFMFNPKSFFPHFRTDNKMDVFFAPQETVDQAKRLRSLGLLP